MAMRGVGEEGGWAYRFSRFAVKLSCKRKPISISNKTFCANYAKVLLCTCCIIFKDGVELIWVKLNGISSEVFLLIASHSFWLKVSLHCGQKRFTETIMNR